MKVWAANSVTRILINLREWTNVTRNLKYLQESKFSSYMTLRYATRDTRISLEREKYYASDTTNNKYQSYLFPKNFRLNFGESSMRLSMARTKNKRTDQLTEMLAADWTRR